MIFDFLTVLLRTHWENRLPSIVEQTIKKQIDELYAAGRTTVMGEEELEKLVLANCKDGRSLFNRSEI